MRQAAWTKVRKNPKYHNKRTETDGIKFASEKEALRYQELMLMQRAGEISDLDVHPRFEIVVKGMKICTYIADFSYIPAKPGHLNVFTKDSERVVEDVKGVRTRDYIIKKKLMKAVHDISVVET